MRSVTYRGKRVDNGETVKGYLVVAGGRINTGRHFILDSANQFGCVDNGGMSIGTFYEVDPYSVAACTGLRDKNGRLIYEGDVVLTKYGRPCRVYPFVSASAGMCWDLHPLTWDKPAPSSYDLWASYNLEVVDWEG